MQRHPVIHQDWIIYPAEELASKSHRSRTLYYNDNSEFLLDNYIEKDLQDFLLPLHLILNVVLHHKFQIRYNFITPTSWVSTSISGIFYFIYIATYFVYMTKLYYENSNFRAALGMLVYAHFAEVVTLVFGVFVSNLVHKECNVRTLVLLQSAKRMIISSTYRMKNLCRGNWVSIGVLTLNFICVELAASHNMEWSSVLVMINYYNLTLFDVTIVYVIRVTKLLRTLMECWIVEMKLLRKNTTFVVEDKIGNSLCWNKMFKAYNNLVESFCIMNKSSAVEIFFYFIKSFVMSVIFLQIVISIGKLGVAGAEVNISVIIIRINTCSWLAKNLIIICLLCSECDQLYKIVSTVETECYLALNMGTCSEVQRRVLKNVIRLNHYHLSNLAPWSLFVVDATLPISFGSLITTYAVVTLQFELPKQD